MAKKPTSKRGKTAKVERVMHEFKTGALRSSSGQKVTSRAQAEAIAMSESGQSKRKRRKK